MSTLREIGEFGLIDRLARLIPRAPAVVEGIGDDCAIIDYTRQTDLIITTDSLCEGTHFNRNYFICSVILSQLIHAAPEIIRNKLHLRSHCIHYFLMKSSSVKSKSGFGISIRIFSTFAFLSIVKVTSPSGKDGKFLNSI